MIDLILQNLNSLMIDLILQNLNSLIVTARIHIQFTMEHVKPAIPTLKS